VTTTTTGVPAAATALPDSALPAPLVLPGDGAEHSGRGGERTTRRRSAGPRTPRTRRRLRWRRPRTAGRLAALHALVLAIVLGAVSFALVENFSRSYEAVAEQSLAAELHSFQHFAQVRPPRQDLWDFTQSYLRSHTLPTGEEVVVVLPGRGTVGSAGSVDLTRLPAVHSMLGSPPAQSSVSHVVLDGYPTLMVAAPVLIDGHPAATFVAATDVSTLEQERSRLLMLSLFGAAIALGTAVVSAFLLLRRLLREVGGITRAADDISRGDLHRRLGDRSGRRHQVDDEVGQLARSFDTMLDHLDTAVTAQRRLLSDVSHQLRTPLTVARGQLEVLGRTDVSNPAAVASTIDLVVDELEHMRMLVDRLLQLGRAMEPESLSLEAVDVRAFATDLFEASRVIAPRAWTLAAIPDLVVVADPAKLRGALLNLVENAIKATKPADTIALRVTAAAATVTFSVEDSGPGIPVTARSAVLTRFARPGARDAGGTGLGLAIVKAVADAHGGRVDVTDSGLGGAKVSIILPRTPGATMGG
jgi:two-component system OmpR family sensor kinase